MTPRIETISPQFMWSVAEIASKILSRVWSASALDIFSTSERFIVNLECSQLVERCRHTENRLLGNGISE